MLQTMLKVHVKEYFHVAWMLVFFANEQFSKYLPLTTQNSPLNKKVIINTVKIQISFQTSMIESVVFVVIFLHPFTAPILMRLRHCAKKNQTTTTKVLTRPSHQVPFGANLPIWKMMADEIGPELVCQYLVLVPLPLSIELLIAVYHFGGRGIMPPYQEHAGSDGVRVRVCDIR